jgi:hypothetical protein
MAGYGRLCIDQRASSVIALAMLVLPLASSAAIPAGTGFFVTSDGYFLTCLRVIDGAQRVTLKTTNGNAYDASVVAVDPPGDLAVLKATGKFSPLPLAGDAHVRSGARVLTMGFAGLEAQDPKPRVTKGVLGSPDTKAKGCPGIHITIPVQPGNCGGPLITPDGNVVGVITAKSNTPKTPVAGVVVELVNHAVGSSHALTLLSVIRDVRNKLPKPFRKPRAGDSELARMLRQAIAIVIVDTNRGSAEEEQDRDREQVERIRRAIRKEESQRAETSRKLDSEQARQREVSRLQTLVSNLEREESSLHGEMLATEQRLLFMPRDGVSLADLALRGEMEARLAYLKTQLHQKTTSKQAAMRQLSELRLR